MVGTDRSGAGPLRLVCFELRGQELALPIGDVRETLPVQPITHVFLTPPIVAGVFSLRGEIVPALDIGVLLGLARTEIGDDTRLVVIERPQGSAALVVDRLRDLRTLDAALDPAPSNVPSTMSTLLLGVAATSSGTVRVLDAGAILDAVRDDSQEGRTP